MISRSSYLIAWIALITAPGFLFAQETTANEDERIEQLVRSEASEWYTPKNSVSVGFRVLTSGANVSFGNLGAIGRINPAGELVYRDSSVAPASAGRVNREYDNGFVDVDGLRADEVNASGGQTSTPGGRYTGSVITDSLSYTPGQTRVWGFSTPEQIDAVPGYIAMSTYSATSDGASYSKKEGMTAGVELQFAHAMRKIGKRLELSFVAGLAINGINNKTSGDVQSTLHTFTDYYVLKPQDGIPLPVATPEDPYTAPSDNGGTKETTTPVGVTPDDSLHPPTSNSVAGAATVHGRWQIKGAYFMMRIGPSLRAQVTDRFGVSASLGLAGVYAGTHYTAAESMEIPILGTTISDPVISSDESKFLSGYYADFNVDWTANETLGLYGGVSAQKFGDYTQTLGDRTARIDLGSSVGLRGGINIKF